MITFVSLWLLGAQGGGERMHTMMQWHGLDVMVVSSRLVAVGLGEVDKSERYFEGRSQALVRLKEKEGVKDDL